MSVIIIPLNESDNITFVLTYFCVLVYPRSLPAGHPASHLPHGMSLGAAAAGLSPHHHLPHQAGGGVNPGAIGTGDFD